MSRKIISKMSLKTIALAAVITVCGVFCFDYIISNEASATRSSTTHYGANTGGGSGPKPGTASTAGSGPTRGK